MILCRWRACLIIRKIDRAKRALEVGKHTLSIKCNEQTDSAPELKNTRSVDVRTNQRGFHVWRFDPSLSNVPSLTNSTSGPFDLRFADFITDAAATLIAAMLPIGPRLESAPSVPRLIVLPSPPFEEKKSLTVKPDYVTRNTLMPNHKCHTGRLIAIYIVVSLDRDAKLRD